MKVWNGGGGVQRRGGALQEEFVARRLNMAEVKIMRRGLVKG